MAIIYTDKDATLDLIRGAQGRSDRIRQPGTCARAEPEGFRRRRARRAAPGEQVAPEGAGGGTAGADSVAEAAAEADLIMILAPDEKQKKIYEEDIRPHLSAGKALFFAHGFNIHYGQIQPPEGVDVVLIAPKAPGHMVRRLFESGQGTPALIAVHQDASGKAKELGLSYARGLGRDPRRRCWRPRSRRRRRPISSASRPCSAAASPRSCSAGYETLVEAGYQPESAYFECLHELKLIVDMMYEGGLGWMRHSISDTAEYGDYSRGPRVMNETVRAEMKKILREIQTGQFAREWILENQAGRPVVRQAARGRQGAPHRGGREADARADELAARREEGLQRGAAEAAPPRRWRRSSP